MTLHWRLRDARWRLRMQTQRVFRGYSDVEWYALDSWLTEGLALRLRAMADHGHSFPVEYANHEAWNAELRRVALALDVYARDRDEEITEAQIAEAKDALRWVADHIQTLWD